MKRHSLVGLFYAATALCGPALAEKAKQGNVPQEVVELKAEGFGAASKGGEGGEVLWVTNLNDSGPGSLREALKTKGPAIIRFKVGGIVKLQDAIRPNDGAGVKGLTLDGLSAAPYGGITVDGTGGKRKGGIVLEHSEDVVIRHMRFQGGYSPLIVCTSERVVIDHVSTRWAIDENLSVWNSRNVTLQWCIIAEGAVEGHNKGVPHSMGSLQGGGSGNVTTHHCLFTGNSDRNPLVCGPVRDQVLKGAKWKGPYRFDVINNTIYNCLTNTKIYGEAFTNLIGNYYRPGPDCLRRPGVIMNSRRDGIHPRTHCQGNVGPYPRSATDTDEFGVLWIMEEGNKWSRATGMTGVKLGVYAPSAEKYVSRQPFEGPPVTSQPASEAHELVLQHAGAFPRDSEDERLVGEVRNLNGKVGRVGLQWYRRHWEERAANKRK